MTLSQHGSRKRVVGHRHLRDSLTAGHRNETRSVAGSGRNPIVDRRSPEAQWAPVSQRRSSARLPDKTELSVR